MAMTLEELQILITAETKQLNRELGGIKQQMAKFEENVNRRTTNAGAAFKRFAAIASAAIASISIKSAVDDAKQYEASLGQINRMLGQYAGDFEHWATTQGKLLGMARLEAVKYGAVYANLLSGFSRDSAELTKRTQDLLQASAVVASSTGRTVDDVMERIRSGLLGNTEAIEDLGINVNIALIETTNAFKQFANGKSWDQLDFNMQQTIRYFAILEQAASKYGNELAQNTNTRQAIFISYLKDARLYLGQAFLPIYNAVLPALTAMAKALAEATQWLSAFMQAIFGKVNQQTSAVVEQSGAVSELGDSYDKAGKKARKAIANFDQVNLIGGSAGGAGGSGGSAVGGIAEGINSSLTETAKTTDKLVEEIRDKLMNLISEQDKEMLKKRVSELRTSFDGLKSSVASLKGNEKFQNFIDGVKQWTIDTAIEKTGGAIHFLNGNLKTLDGLIGVVDGLFDGDFEKTWNSGEKVIAGLNDSLNSMVAFYFPNFAKKWEETTDKWGENWQRMKAHIKTYGDPSKLEVSDFGDFVKKAVTSTFSEATANAIGKLVELRDNTKSKWEEIKDKTGFSKLEPVIVNVFEAIKTKSSQKLSELRSKVSEKWLDLKSDASIKWAEIKSTVEKKWEEITGIKWSTVETALSTTWDVIKTTADTKWQGVVGVVKTNVNKIIELINKMIRGVNKFSIDVPDWVSKLPGVPDDIKSIGFSIPEIPKLAVGTNYVAQDGLAYLHEGEAVVPKKYNPAAGGESGAGNREVIAALRQVERAVRDLRQIQAVISGDAVGRAATGFINSEIRRGNNPLPAL